MLLAQTRHSEQRAALLGLALGFLPFLSWVGAGIAATWALRRGVLGAQWAVAGILVPGLVLAWQGDASSLVGGVVLLVLIEALRASARWDRVLQVLVGLGLLATLAIELLFSAQLPLIIDLAGETLRAMAGDWLDQVPDETLTRAITQLVVGSLTMVSVTWALMALLVARWYQSRIWNPGGFAQEVLALRLSPVFATLLAAAVAFGGVIGIDAGRYVPVLAVPLIAASLSLIHAFLARWKVPAGVHAMPYVLSLVLLSVVVPMLLVLAVADSYFNFRKLQAHSTHEDS